MNQVNQAQLCDVFYLEIIVFWFDILHCSE